MRIFKMKFFIQRSLCLVLINFFLVHQTTATPLQIINDTNYNFVISDHRLQAAIVTPEDSFDMQLQQNTALYFYMQSPGETKTFKFLCSLKEKVSTEQIIPLFLTDFTTHNFAAYPELIFSQTANIIQESSTSSKPVARPTTETETQNFLDLIKQQQQVARENFQNNNPVKPTRSAQENMAQKATALVASRQQSVHQFARSSRK